jgi:23S rRNA G2069 N7-methylase RlmK/C1962 C5-methylase RlmI
MLKDQIESVFKSFKDESARRARRLRSDNATMRKHSKTLKGLLKLLGADHVNDSINISADSYDDVVSIRIYTYGLESFKCDRVTSMLAVLETWKPIVQQEVRDYPSSINRAYTYKYEGMRVSLDVYVKSDSPTCRKVEIGEKVVVDKIYEIQCD